MGASGSFSALSGRGPPPEVWGTVLTPSKWRSQDTSNLNALQLAAISNFKLVRFCLHARKRKEYSSRIYSHSAAREDKLRAGTMHIGFQSLLNMSSLTTPICYTMTLATRPSRPKRQWTFTIISLICFAAIFSLSRRWLHLSTMVPCLGTPSINDLC